jgi:uncharacterized protein DUF3455
MNRFRRNESREFSSRWPAVSAGLLLAAVAVCGTASAADAVKAAAEPRVAAKPAVSAKKSMPASRPCPQHVPEELNPPANATLEFGLDANGVQIYRCAAAPDTKTPVWTLEAPHAVLGAGAPTVIHFAGPTWQALDGSRIKGARLASVPAPDAGSVPWLLLGATPEGEGTFARTTHVQRLATAGGVAPSAGCDAAHIDARVLVPYRSTYFFYRSAEPNEAVRQCHSGPAKTKHN